MKHGKNLLSWLLLGIVQVGGEDSTIVCPGKGDTDTLTNLQPNDPNGPNFLEISGLALSPFQTSPDTGAPVMYAVNDGGGGKRLGVFDSSSGKRLMTLRLGCLPSSKDWESLAIGSCGVGFDVAHESSLSCIYIADTGDNLARRFSGTRSRRAGVPYRIYKIREPLLQLYQDNGVISVNDTQVLEYDYSHPSSPALLADSEAMFLDHTGWGRGEIGDLYLVTKWSREDNDSFTKTRLFRIPASAWLDASKTTYSPVAVGSYDNGGDLLGKTWTGADMSLDGTLVALTSRDEARVFPRCPGTSVANALTNGATSCLDWSNNVLNSPHVKQIETIAWTPDGTRTLQISECKECEPPMVWTIMNHDSPDPDQIISCPIFPVCSTSDDGEETNLKSCTWH